MIGKPKAKDLLKKLRGMKGNAAEVVKLMDSTWSQLSRDRKDIALTECCRHAMQACQEMRRFGVAELWKARMLSCALHSGDSNAIVALLMPFAFTARAKKQDQGARAAAAGIMDEMEVLVPFANNPRSDLDQDKLRGLCYEKRAFFNLDQGKFRESQRDYKKALSYLPRAGYRRDKVEAGLALCLYLSSEDEEVRERAKKVTKEISNHPDPDWDWLARQAKKNVLYMEGKRKNWVPYEVL